MYRAYGKTVRAYKYPRASLHAQYVHVHGWHVARSRSKYVDRMPKYLGYEACYRAPPTSMYTAGFGLAVTTTHATTLNCLASLWQVPFQLMVIISNLPVRSTMKSVAEYLRNLYIVSNQRVRETVYIGTKCDTICTT